jgi:hypothetical protein
MCILKKQNFMHVPLQRDWVEPHPDQILCILHWLNQAELLIGGVAGVCCSWRHRAANQQEPELWRRIYLGGGLTFAPPCRTVVSLSTMLQVALWYSAAMTATTFSLCSRSGT